MQFSIGLPLLGAVLVLALGLASAAEEREAQRQIDELRAQRVAALTLVAECLDDETTCESVLTTCTRVLGDGLGCACWQPVDEDGAR